MEEATARRRTRQWRIVARPQDAWFLALAAVIVGLDQFTKWVIRAEIERGDATLDLGVVKIVHIVNTGAAFGLFQGAGGLLAVTSVVGMVAILVYLFNPGFAHPLMRLGLALMLGGAIGNLIDRVSNGEVVDFIKVPHFWAFNVADSAITIGVLVLLWTMLHERPEESPPANS
ncbi:MAG: signal peptidase II [Dehalococcoidia bacterium]